MKQVALSVAASFILCAAPIASAATAEEASAIAKAADSYLSAVPADSYLITSDKLLERIRSGKNDFVVLDVRTPKEKSYDLGHIPGAVHIGFRDLAKPENLAKLPKDKDIILYCNTGQDENKDLTVLRMLGYRAYGLKWGYMAWNPAPPTDLTLKAIDGSKSGRYPVEK